MLQSAVLLCSGFTFTQGPTRAHLVRSASLSRSSSSVMQGIVTDDDEVEARFRAMEQSFATEAKPTKSEPAIDSLMEKHGYPLGLAQKVLHSAKFFPHRYAILDNSGSMNNADGQRLGVGLTGTAKVVGCTRWEELTADVKSMCEIAQITGSRVELFPINPIMGSDPIVISDESSAKDAAEACKKLPPPNNGTPLSETVELVANKISAMAPALRESSQMACVVIGTDGKPDDPERFERALGKLLKLPVWLVVRLCTNQGDVVDYYNELDGQLEANIEVLDDVQGEADEISKAGNGWLAYGRPLHLARFGMRDSIYDLIDEGKLLNSQIKTFCESLLGVPELPDPDLDAPAFLAELDDALAQNPKVFDPLSNKMSPWINIDVLKARLS